MKKREIINILKPYWLEYLKNNGELERKLQLEKFVGSFNGLARLNFFALLNIEKYFSFKVSNYLLFRRFWVISRLLAKFKKNEEDLNDFKLKFKDHLTIQDIKDIEEKEKDLRNAFDKTINDYLEFTLGAPDREMRLWSTYIVIKSINSAKLLDGNSNKKPIV